MAPLQFRCPITGLHVNGFVLEENFGDDPGGYEPLTCLSCGEMHLVNFKTGKTVGESRQPSRVALAQSALRSRGSHAGIRTFRILCVDDEADICEILELSLALDPAFSVRSCESGVEAIALATDWCPDMILCDVMMPQMDGPTTLARLRACPSTADIPVVFVTACVQPAELAHFKSLGVTDVITKPFDPMTIPNVVRTHLRSQGDLCLRPPHARA